MKDLGRLGATGKVVSLKLAATLTESPQFSIAFFRGGNGSRQGVRARLLDYSVLLG
jgi:hypothetical protein